MRIAVWKTGHPIADRVAQSVFDGLPPDCVHLSTSFLCDKAIEDYDAHIAYGILRGTADVFRKCDRQGKPWLHLDRGYTNPGHFDGKYRISYRGTQQTSNWPEPVAHSVSLSQWRGFDHSKPVLVVPPTLAVDTFFQLGAWVDVLPENYIIRHKGDPTPLIFNDYNYVLTFNSSLGWQAIAAGVPCVSDPTHSMVGAWYDAKLKSTGSDFSLDALAELQYLDRNELFGCMEAMQFTLQDIEQGKAWAWINHLLTARQ